jgi:hypothetical protein
MSSNKGVLRAQTIALALVSVGCAHSATFECPALPNTHERYVQLFDGPSAEAASLQAEAAGPNEGIWKVGTVYDNGRTVTFQCVYANKEKREFTPTHRVETCRYRTAPSGITRLDCH